MHRLGKVKLPRMVEPDQIDMEAMPKLDALPQAVEQWCTEHGYGDIIAARALSGGAISHTWRIETSCGSTLIAKRIA